MDSPEYPATRSLERWFASLYPTRINIVGDFAGRELFILEGDSLLRVAFSDERIDMNEGLQVLHSAYVVERFLHNLKNRGCHFHVIFFECHENFCIPEHANRDNCYKYQLSRACIIQHLRRYAATGPTEGVHSDQISGEDEQATGPGSMPTGRTNSEFQVHEFLTPYSQKFRLYIKRIRPYFILTHDGSTLKHGDNRNLSRIKLQKGVLLGFMRHILSINVTVGLIQEVEFQNSKVFTLIIPASEVIVPTTLTPGIFSHLYESLSQELQTPATGLKAIFEKVNTQAPIRTANINPNLDPSTILHLQSLAMVAKQQATISPEYIAAFILHLVLKRFLSLSQRRISRIGSSGRLGPVFTKADEFLKSLGMCQLTLFGNSGYSHSLISATSGVQSLTGFGLADHIDGRLFKYVLSNLVSIQNVEFPSDILAYYDSLLEAFKDDTGLDISQFGLQHCSSSNVNYPSRCQMPDGEAEDDTTGATHASLRVLPFSNPVFNEHLSYIQLAVDTQLSAQMPTLSPLEKALYESHWHSTRRLDDMRAQGDKLVRIPQKLKWWQLKGNQVALTKMLRYAKNLAGGEINPELIVVKKFDVKVVRNQAKNAEQNQSNRTARAKVGKALNCAQAQASKIEQIKAANEQRISIKNQTKAVASWKSFYRELCVPCETKRRAIVALTGFISKSKEETVTIEARLFKCCLLFEVWKEEYCVSKENKSRGYTLVALIFNEAKLILASPKLTVCIKDALDAIFTLLGFTPLSSPKSFPSPEKVSFILPPPIPSKSVINTKAGKDLKLHDFQLQYCGPYMERNLDPVDDPRVKFKPDGWQIKVLDALDEDKSVFVVAPTSSGKTFIAYYAMEKILRADNDGVLVYIAPTKALVNQIAAELQTRFDKKYKDAHTVWAIHTRDYRINSPQKCQILVTVPHILQIMLLSPALASSWSPRLKRIVLDEVHCIGKADDGVVWEQILLLAPCPIIALSATVGNPVQFHKWLQLTQSTIVRQKPGKGSTSEGIARGVTVELIHHRHRYNDLRKFRYSIAIQHPTNFIDDGTVFKGLDKVPVGTHLGIPNLDDIPRFRFIHPIAALYESDDHLPDDLVLESRDCYTLWCAMVSVQNAKYPVPKGLEPSSASFPEIINKVDVIKWEEALKCILRTWLKDRDSPMAKLLDLLRTKNSNVNIEDASNARGKWEAYSQHFLDTMQLLSDLHKLNALPALLFIYDRETCNRLCKHLVNILEVGENQYRQTNLEWKRKVEEKESFNKAKRRVKIPKKVAADNLEDPRDALDSVSIEYFDPNAPIQEFTLADPSKCSKAELESELQELRLAEIPEVFTRALQRGIGVHHAGIPRPLRECVERLFRKGYLRVVIATGTLSLGINMPCATVVFVTDNVYLTPLNFRQASGRAGRRGFDFLGNVVFHKIPVYKVHRLMNSHLPSLTGHFPTSTTLILRLFILLYGSGNSDHAVASINTLLSQNHISVGLEQINFKEQVMHHVRFSIEYLRRTNLLNASGTPINFANCVANLYYTEPGNLMLNALLHAGVFHRICSQFSTASLSGPESDSVKGDVNRNLMLILAHFFGRIPFTKGADLKALLQRRSSSTVVLAKLPEEALNVIREHNQLTLEIFINYIKTFAEQHPASVPDNTLPFTSTRPSPTPAPESIHLGSNSLPSGSARSCFVSLSGHSDHFTSIDDLLTSCRGDILLESSGIPYIPVDEDIKLNAYLYDFFLHGSVVELEKANGISKSGVWFVLNDFSMVLATVVTCLKNLIIYGPDGDMRLADGENPDLGAGDVLEAKRDVKAAAGEDARTKDSPSNRRQNTALDDSESEFSDDDSDDSASYIEQSGGSNEREQLLKVLKGFVGLQTSFNEKFKAISATKSDRNKGAGRRGKKRLPNLRI